jgi:hypothetical protein
MLCVHVNFVVDTTSRWRDIESLEPADIARQPRRFVGAATRPRRAGF